jgi:3-oxoacyl-[acyl-carrier-protein] synthase-3
MHVARPTLLGAGRYLPARRVTNAELAEHLDTSDEWIYERTGIRARHIASAAETMESMAIKAAQAALDQAGIAGPEIDLTIVSSVTPGYAAPSCASTVQGAVGAHGAAFNMSAGCSGFVYALAVAWGLLDAGLAHQALIIGSEVMSRVLDWSDRRTTVLFGDGAGAVVLGRAEHAGPPPAFTLGSDGARGPLLVLPGGGTSEMQDGRMPRGVRMNGQEVFRFGKRQLVQTARQVAEKAGVSLEAIDWFVPHQANARIIDAAATCLGIPSAYTLGNIERYANTVSASIPLAIADAAAADRLMPGQSMLLVGFGAGLSWGGGLLSWRD